MKKITKACLGVAAAAAVAGIGAVMAFAYGHQGGERKTFTWESPASYVTFNSITNNPTIGDERNFMMASEFSGSADKNEWMDIVDVKPGHRYVVRMYVHNDASTSLGKDGYAKNTRAKVSYPTNSGTNINLQGHITADNATPKDVFDSVQFRSTDGRKFTLAYVEGEARFWNMSGPDFATKSYPLDTPNHDLFTKKGVQLGWKEMNGEFPGCNEYAGFVTFLVEPQFEAGESTLEVNKQVKLKGTKEYGELVDVKAGDTVTYRIEVKNVGKQSITNLTVRDDLPEGISYVPGTSKYYDSTVSGGKYIPVGHDGLFEQNGADFGEYAPGANVFIIFDAVVDKSYGEKCTPTAFRNDVVAIANETDTYYDAAYVTVQGKVCKEEKPDFKIEKTVQNKGGAAWSESVTAAANGQVRYRIQFKNTGSAKLENVKIKDVLPKGINYVAGSTELHNKQNPDGKKMSDDIITAEGLNIGSYERYEEATIYFYAVVDESYEDKCEDSKLTNIASVDHSGIHKEDGADVVVEAASCVEPEPTPEPKPTPTPEPEPELPKTGATGIMSSVIGIASLATAGAYYLASRKK